MPRLIRYDRLKPVPWKNGAGTTREIWKLLHAAGTPAIRISVAEISGDQAFSTFPGIDRIIMQLDGPAMDLVIDGTRHGLQPAVPLPFAGEAAVSCTLRTPGTAHDLNLMCDRSLFRGTMVVKNLQAGEAVALPSPAVLTAVLALAPCTLHAPEPASLGLYDVLLVETSEPPRAATPAKLAILTAQAL